MIIIYIVIAVFIAWIWVDYYRLIDVFEGEKLVYFMLTFLLGSASVLIVFGLNRFWLDSYHFALNGNPITDFAYSVFKIGLVEEIAKITPFIIVFFAFRKRFTEPIDYLAYICISALGFSAAENVLYFHNYGPYIINGRAILSSVGHMFDTSLIAYGIIRYQYFYKGSVKGIFNLLLFVFLAALSHGLYDFWLIDDNVGIGDIITTILYFLVCISFFAVILNNALNNSSVFTYKKVINSDKVASRLLTYYSIVFLIQFILLVFFEDLLYAFINLIFSLFFVGFIVIITCLRLSRFKLIQGRWQRVRLGFPFSISSSGFMSKRSFLNIKVKGETYNEVYVCNYFEEFCMLNSLTNCNAQMEEAHLSYIEKKIFLKNDESFYLAKYFYGNEKDSYDLILLKPKTNNITMVNEKYPIVALLEIKNMDDLENKNATAKNFIFKEWVFIKPRE